MSVWFATERNSWKTMLKTITFRKGLTKMEKKTKTFYEEAGSPMDRMEQLFEKRIEDGMFREVENYFADGYTVQKKREGGQDQ